MVFILFNLNFNSNFFPILMAKSNFVRNEFIAFFYSLPQTVFNFYFIPGALPRAIDIAPFQV